MGENGNGQAKDFWSFHNQVLADQRMAVALKGKTEHNRDRFAAGTEVCGP